MSTSPAPSNGTDDLRPEREGERIPPDPNENATTTDVVPDEAANHQVGLEAVNEIKPIPSLMTIENLDVDSEVELVRESFQTVDAVSNQKPEFVELVDQNQSDVVTVNSELSPEVSRRDIAIQTFDDQSSPLPPTGSQLSAEDLNDKLKRLTERLITVEEDYTSEILELERKESQAREELRQALETIKQLKNCIKEADQPSNWTERMEKLKAERDQALQEVSKYDDKVHKLTASVTNLQLAIEQIQKENEKKLSTLSKQHQAALESERAIQNDLRSELEIYEKKSLESAQALQAATRLTENIDKKEEMIAHLKQELNERERQIGNLELDKANLRVSFEGKVDKQVIKNLILGYFGTPHDKKHEVERLLARVLDFNEQEMIRAGLSFGRPSTKFGLGSLSSAVLSPLSSTSSLITGVSSGTTLLPTTHANSTLPNNTQGSILLAPLAQSANPTGPHHSPGSLSSASSSTSLYSESNTSAGSLSKMFVEFLEAESRPKKGPIHSIHPTSSVTRELARDLTKVALTPNNKMHPFLDPSLSRTSNRIAPLSPASSTSTSTGPATTVPSSPSLYRGLPESHQPNQQAISNHVTPFNEIPATQIINPLLTSTPSISANKLISSLSDDSNNPIRNQITINNKPDPDSSSFSIGSTQHQPPLLNKASFLSPVPPSQLQPQQTHQPQPPKSTPSPIPTPATLSSSSLTTIINPMSSFTAAIKPITIDSNNHTHQQSSSPMVISSSSSSLNAATTTYTTIPAPVTSSLTLPPLQQSLSSSPSLTTDLTLIPPTVHPLSKPETVSLTPKQFPSSYPLKIPTAINQTVTPPAIPTFPLTPSTTIPITNTIISPVASSLLSSSSSSTTASSSLLLAASCSDYNTLISNSHLKVKK